VADVGEGGTGPPFVVAMIWPLLLRYRALSRFTNGIPNYVEIVL
jgi:hypothetical protein